MDWGMAAQSRITVEIKMYKKGHLNWTYGTTTSASIATHTHSHTHTQLHFIRIITSGKAEEWRSGGVGKGLQILPLPAATITICPFVGQWLRQR